MAAQAGQHHALLVVVLAQDPVVGQVEPIPHAESIQTHHHQVRISINKSRNPSRNPKRCRLLPLVALLAGEAVQVVNVALGPHHHLEGRDDFAARGTVARRPEQPAKINGINHQMI